MRTAKSPFDYHAHTRFSDGELSPSDLVSLALERQVESLAITDHDTTLGLEQGIAAAEKTSLQLVLGIELSVSWHGKTIHVVGLNIDPSHPALCAGIRVIQALRESRAASISEKLSKKLMPGALEDVVNMAGEGQVTRTHFARWLVEQGHAPDMNSAFKKYLGQGKPAYVKTEWSSLEDAVAWITGAGGVAVIAHPLRYRLTAAWMHRLIKAFMSAGGRGYEVVSGKPPIHQIQQAAYYAKRYELLGSVGSDFHGFSNPWGQLGQAPLLPQGILPVTTAFC